MPQARPRPLWATRVSNNEKPGGSMNVKKEKGRQKKAGLPKQIGNPEGEVIYPLNENKFSNPKTFKRPLRRRRRQAMGEEKITQAGHRHRAL